jgi:hypothetical protein
MTFTSCRGHPAPHRLTYEKFRVIKPGMRLAAVEHKLGLPQYRRTNTLQTCLGWDRLGQPPVDGHPAFIACFRNQELVTTSILDPRASD